MTRSCYLALVLAACGGDDSEWLPIVPGSGPGTGGSTMRDAAVGPFDAPDVITGRACLLLDARAPTTCAATGAGGLVVALGDQQATTADDGAFSILHPGGTDLVWRVSGDGVEPSALRFDSATATTVPVMDSIVYGEMVAAMNAIVSAGAGGIIARLATGGVPRAGLVVTSSPLPDSEIYYDGLGVADWELVATGPSGVTWISSIMPGTASLTVDTGTELTTVSSIPVFADTITFVFAEIP